MLARDPQADAAALQRHPMRNALTNVVGSRARTTVHLAEYPMHGGELFALTTDGVHGVLDGPRLAALVNNGGDPKSIAAGLVEAAIANGSRDNCTAVVAEYVE